jgi:hypothetical protein
MAGRPAAAAVECHFAGSISNRTLEEHDVFQRRLRSELRDGARLGLERQDTSARE